MHKHSSYIKVSNWSVEWKSLNVKFLSQSMMLHTYVNISAYIYIYICGYFVHTDSKVTDNNISTIPGWCSWRIAVFCYHELPHKVWSVQLLVLSPPCGERLKKQPDLTVHAQQCQHLLSVLKSRLCHMKVSDFKCALCVSALPPFSCSPLSSLSGLTHLAGFTQFEPRLSETLWVSWLWLWWVCECGRLRPAGFLPLHSPLSSL